MTGPTPTREGPGGWLFWLSAALGAAIVGWAVAGALDAHRATNPPNLARFLLGAGVAHDALVAPAAVVVGLVTARWLPGWARLPVRIGLALTLLTVLISWPVVRAYGRRPGHPSLLPLAYGTNLLAALAAIWAAVLVASLVARRRATRGGS
jgi:hypothetical protein